jgi:hypothetical protein
MALTKKTVDHSDTGHFSFSFFCDCCGKEWVSPEKIFSGGPCERIEKNTALLLLWKSEHRIAFEEANLDARSIYNRCPDCNRWVCDGCFNLGEKNFGKCKDCNTGSNEK